MSKRRDNRGRVLRSGEFQMKDGRYRFKYQDFNGKERAVYSTRLDIHDSTPPGKRRVESLREKEDRIRNDVYNHVLSNGGDYTVIELVEKYVMTKIAVRPTTVKGYNTVINMLKLDPFGRQRIDKVRISDAKCWLISLQQLHGRGYSSIHSIRGVLKPAFQMAVDDDLIRKNPFGFQLADVVVNDSVKRHSLTPDEEERFLKFVQEDKHFSRYYEGIYILFKTGMRISEFCGLTVRDINFKYHSINIDHQLMKGSKGYYIQKTKTDSGTRVLPMTPDVEACFRKIIANRNPPKVEPMIDGKVGFLYFDKDGSVMYSLHWDHYFKHIRQKYNQQHRERIPFVSPHICRHTYCTNMAKAGMNPKTLQYLMGHSEIAVTLDTYTHFGFDDAKEEVQRMRFM